MRYKPSIAFDRMSGSAKGVTASQNKGAVFLRTRGTGSKKRTADQATIKSIFRMLTQSWKNLGPAEIQAWNNAAKTQSGRRVLGQKAQLSGSNLFLRLNFWVVRCGGQVLTSPPVMAGVEQTGQVSLALTDDTLMFHLLQMPQTAGLRLVVMATTPQTVGTITGVGRGSTFCGPFEPSAAAVNLMAWYQAKFGMPNLSRPKIFLRYFYVNPATGEKGPEQLQSVILGQGSSVRFRLDLSPATAGHGTVTPESGEYQDGTVVTIQAHPAQNYAFGRWSDGSTVNPRQIVVDRDIALQAQFVEDIHYTVTTSVSPTGGGQVTGGGAFPRGSQQLLTAIPNTGWRFDHWQETGGTESTVLTPALTGNVHYTAVFTRIQSSYECLWDVNNDEWGTVSPVMGWNTYDHGEEVQLTAVPESDDYEFGRWSDGNTDNPRTLVIQRPTQLTAIFWSVYEETLNIEVLNGRAIPDGGVFHVGQEVEVTVIPDEGYRFVRWDDNPSAGATRVVTIQEYMPVLRAVCEWVE